MPLDLVEACGICECCFELLGAIGHGIFSSSSLRETVKPSGVEDGRAGRRARRLARDRQRGFILSFQGRRIANIQFLRGEAEGRAAPAMGERELLRLVSAEPGNRALRLAVSCYLRNRRRNRIGAAR